MLQMTADARLLLTTAQEVARLRGAARCTPHDLGAAITILSHRAGSPVGFTAQQTSPDMLAMDEAIQQVFDTATAPVGQQALVATATSANEALTAFLEGR